MTEKKLASYIRRAQVVAENSPDAETKVGSILVSKTTGSVISEGYNGFVRGANDDKLPKIRPAKYEFIIHAEENLICNAARNGVRTEDCFIVQTISPCVNCARRLYQAGVSIVYYKEWYTGSDKVAELGDLKFFHEIIGPYHKITISPNKRLK